MLSERILNLQPSATVAINRRVLELKKDGREIISFGIGEPNFNVPDIAKEAVQKALRENFSRYTQVEGIPELKQAIIQKLRAENNLDYNEKEIICSSGAKQVLYNLFLTIINPGDEVLVPSPYWVSYLEQIKLAAGVPVIVPTDENFALRMENILPYLTSKTKALVLNSPNNPTGVVMSKDELLKIAGLCLEKNILIISDEVYEYFVYSDSSPPARGGAGGGGSISHMSIASLAEEIKNITLTINAVSKSFGMTGWRLGYAAGPEEIISGMKKLQEQTTANPSSLAQCAAAAAIPLGKNWMTPQLEEFKKKRDFVCAELSSAGIKIIPPAGAFYIFFKIRDANASNYTRMPQTIYSGSVDFCKRLLDREGVALVPGAAFGDDSYARLSYACGWDDLKRGMEKIKNFCKL